MSVLWPSLLYDTQGPHAPVAYDSALPATADVAPGSQPFNSGVRSGDGTVDEAAFTRSGVLQPGVNETFYNRILIEPSLLEMGNLLSDQTREVLVWNGYLTDKNVESFTRENDIGIAVDEPAVAPYVLNALAIVTYTLSISTDGPSTIDARYTWTVDGVDYRGSVTGHRVVTWPFPPNWATPVTEGLEWFTQVIRSYDGSEQRRSFRTKARRSFSYTMSLAGKDTARFEALLWGWQNRLYALPVWTDKARLTSAHLSGDTVLLLDTTDLSFAVGGLAVLYNGTRDFEVIEVESLTTGSMTLKRPIERAWAQGSLVMPALLGHMPNAVATNRHTSNALTAVMDFQGDVGTTDPFTPSAAAPTTYDGIEVITTKPNWAGPIPHRFEYAFDTLDKGTGLIQWVPTEDFPRIQRGYSWLLKTRSQIVEFRKMLARRQGQLKAVHVPSWHDDFKVVGVIGASDTAINVESDEFRQMVGVDPARDRLMIRLHDGTVFYRKIVGIAFLDPETELTMDSSLGQEVQPSDVLTVHLLMRSRLSTDRIDIVWHTDSVAVVETPFITVKE